MVSLLLLVSPAPARPGWYQWVACKRWAASWHFVLLSTKLIIVHHSGSTPVTGYAHDEDGNLIYLGMVGHKTVLDSIRATIQARQRKKLFLQGRSVYPLPTHYCQTWQHLPDYGAYHAALIADPALPDKWQPGEDVVYLLVFEGEGETPEEKAMEMLTVRLSEALPFPVLDDWNRQIWETAQRKGLVVDLQTCGDCQQGYVVQLGENAWKEVVIGLMKGQKIHISSY